MNDVTLLIAGALLFASGLALGGSVVLAMWRALKNARSQVDLEERLSVRSFPSAALVQPLVVVAGSFRQATTWVAHEGVSNWKYAGGPGALRGYGKDTKVVVLPGACDGPASWTEESLEYELRMIEINGGEVVREAPLRSA